MEAKINECLVVFKLGCCTLTKNYIFNEKALARKAWTEDWLCDPWSDKTQIRDDSRVLFGLL